MRSVHAAFEALREAEQAHPARDADAGRDDRRPGAARRHDRRAPPAQADRQAGACSRPSRPSKRLEKLYELMQAEIEILQVEKKIRSRVKKQMEKTQKEYYLNEQMQAIQKELGERDEFKNEIQELEEKLKTKKMSQGGHAQGQEGAQEAQDDAPDERRGDRRAQLHRLDPLAALVRQDQGQARHRSRPRRSSTRTTTA